MCVRVCVCIGAGGGEFLGEGGRKRRREKEARGANEEKQEDPYPLSEGTRVLNRRNEVVISALTRRRDALEREMNREPAPPLLVYFSFLEIPRPRGSRRLSFLPLSLPRPFNAQSTVAERGGKEGVRERKPTSFSG